MSPKPISCVSTVDCGDHITLGCSGGPVYGFDHGREVPRAHPRQVGIVTCYLGKLNQAFTSPLWLVLMPVRVMLSALMEMAVEKSSMPQWGHCPLVRCGLDYHKKTPINLDKSHAALAIRSSTCTMVSTAAVCRPLCKWGEHTPPAPMNKPAAWSVVWVVVRIAESVHKKFTTLLAKVGVLHTFIMRMPCRGSPTQI